MDRNYEVVTFLFQNNFILSWSRLGNFADTTKNATMFIEKNL